MHQFHNRRFSPRRRAVIALAALLVSSVLAGCGSDEPEVDPLYREVQAVFATSCGAGPCHFATIPGGGLDLSPGNECDAMIGVASLEVPTAQLVVPGEPDRSYLVCKLTPDCTDRPAGATLMPPGGVPLLSAEQVSAIEQWITAGLPGCSESIE